MPIADEAGSTQVTDRRSSLQSPRIHLLEIYDSLDNPIENQHSSESCEDALVKSQKTTKVPCFSLAESGGSLSYRPRDEFRERSRPVLGSATH